MHEHKNDTTAENKSRLTKKAKTEKELSVGNDEIFSFGNSVLGSADGRIGDSSITLSHASTLKRAQGSNSSQAGQFLLQLQKQYGNSYVQRVIDLSKKADNDTSVAPEIEQSIQQARGGGQALDSKIRTQMESSFGSDFSSVRVHTNSQANALNHALRSRAFTTGKDIFFKQGEYSPECSGGRELLAHELTHVVQQAGGIHSMSVGKSGDRYEQEADEVARLVIQQEHQTVSKETSKRPVQRQPEEEEIQMKTETVKAQKQTEEEGIEKIQVKPITGQVTTPDLEARIQSLRLHNAPYDTSTKAQASPVKDEPSVKGVPQHEVGSGPPDKNEVWSEFRKELVDDYIDTIQIRSLENMRDVFLQGFKEAFGTIEKHKREFLIGTEIWTALVTIVPYVGSMFANYINLWAENVGNKEWSTVEECLKSLKESVPGRGVLRKAELIVGVDGFLNDPEIRKEFDNKFSLFDWKGPESTEIKEDNFIVMLKKDKDILALYDSHITSKQDWKSKFDETVGARIKVLIGTKYIEQKQSWQLFKTKIPVNASPRQIKQELREARETTLGYTHIVFITVFNQILFETTDRIRRMWKYLQHVGYSPEKKFGERWHPLEVFEKWQAYIEVCEEEWTLLGLEAKKAREMHPAISEHLDKAIYYHRKQLASYREWAKLRHEGPYWVKKY